MREDRVLGTNNLVSTYSSCLKEHKVTINNRSYYLIKAFYATNTRDDFFSTFTEYMYDDELSKKVEQLIPSDLAYNEYAVLYDVSLTVIAVFNMKYAHYDFEQKKIIFRAPEDILQSIPKGNLTPPKTNTKEKLKMKLQSCQQKVFKDIIEKNKVAIKIEIPSTIIYDTSREDKDILDGKGNLKDLYHTFLEAHKVVINTNRNSNTAKYFNEEYYMIKTFYGTSTRKDFLETYQAHLLKSDDLKEKANIISEKLSYNEYAVLYNQDLKVEIVFNMKFAHYDPLKHEIIYREPEEVLLEFYKENLQSNKVNNMKESLEKIKKERKDKGGFNFMDHAIMYAAAPPLDTKGNHN